MDDILLLAEEKMDEAIDKLAQANYNDLKLVVAN